MIFRTVLKRVSFATSTTTLENRDSGVAKSVAKWVAKTAFGCLFIDRRKDGGTLLYKSINSPGCVVAVSDFGLEVPRPGHVSGRFLPGRPLLTDLASRQPSIPLPGILIGRAWSRNAGGAAGSTSKEHPVERTRC